MTVFYLITIDINIILSNIPYQGGAIIGVFMIQALKGAFMGYRGLLLNAPYKIDSMVWMRMRMMLLNLLLICYLRVC
jgi:hypothetical protein